MGVLDSVGQVAASVIAVVLMLALAVLGFFITVFVVDIGAGLAGYDPSGDFVALSAAIIVAGAIIAGGSPLTAVAGAE